MQIDQLIQTISIAAIPILFAITLHEAAHGYVAKHFGDMTAYQMGRISLNPLRHIDPVGTVLLPLRASISRRAPGPASMSISSNATPVASRSCRARAQ